VCQLRVEQRLPPPAYRAEIPPPERGEQQHGQPKHPPALAKSVGLGVHQREQQEEHTTAEEQRTDQVQTGVA
jgi:hypothetical protein